MHDPYINEHRSIKSLSDLGPDKFDEMSTLARERPDLVEQMLQQKKLIAADSRIINLIISEFSNITIDFPAEGINDIQSIEKSEIEICFTMTHLGELGAIIVSFYIPSIPGEDERKSLCVKGLTAQLLAEDGSIIPAFMMMGNNEGFAFPVQIGQKFRLKLFRS